MLIRTLAAGPSTRALTLTVSILLLLEGAESLLVRLCEALLVSHLPKEPASNYGLAGLGGCSTQGQVVFDRGSGARPCELGGTWRMCRDIAADVELASGVCGKTLDVGGAESGDTRARHSESRCRS